MTDAQAVKGRLLSQLEAVLAFLLPAGKPHGAEFEVGSVAGEAGASLKVSLRGDRRGLWKDFATGQSGDIFDLWSAVKGGLDFAATFAECRRWLGIPTVDRVMPKPKPPPPDMAAVVAMRGTPAMAYLTGRRITEETMRRYRIRGHKRESEFNQHFIAFLFFDPAGDPVMLKSTGITKKPNGKKDIWSTKPWYTLWGWWLVRPTDRRIIITEGEIDAMSLHQLALSDGWDVPVLSLPSGAENMDWIENDFEALTRFEEIIVCSDMDNPGETCAKVIASRLGAARVRRLPIPAGYHDANDFLCRATEEGQTVNLWMVNSYTFDPPALVGVADLQNDVLARLRRERAEDEVNTFLFPRIPFQFRDGEMSLLTGRPGDGKSTILYQTHLHEMRMGRAVLLCSFEIRPDKMVAELVTMAIGHAPNDQEAMDAMRWMNGKLWFVRPSDKYGVAELITDLRYAIARFGVTRWGVDSLHHLAAKENYEGQDNVSLVLYKLAQSTGTHGTLVCHAGKGEATKPPGMHDVEGSGGICKPPDNVLIVHRNHDKAERIQKAIDATDDTKRKEAEALPDGLLIVAKQRHNGRLPRLRLWFESGARLFRDTAAPVAPAPLTQEEQKELF